jgi:hypothetical protein
MSQEKYIGMDVHQATISAGVMDAHGKLLMECLLETNASTIVDFIQGWHGTLSLTFEEGTSAAWLHDLLKPHVSRLVVCDPRKAALLKEGNVFLLLGACLQQLCRAQPGGGSSLAFQAPMRGQGGKIPVLFRHTLHQLNDHRKQVIPGLNSHSGTSDIANHDVDTSSRRPEIDRRHGAKLRRPFFVRHPLPFRSRHFGIRFRCLHRRLVDPLDKSMNIRAGRNSDLNLIPHPLSYGGEVEILALYGIAV